MPHQICILPVYSVVLLIFNPGAEVYNLIASAGGIFILKLDALGDFIWAKAISFSSENINGYSIKVDASGNVIVTGQFNATVDFDPGADVYNFTARNVDIYVLKLGSGGLPVTLVSFEATKKNVDAYLSWTTSVESNSDKFEIERSNNGLLFHYIGEVKASGNSTVLKSYTYTDINIENKYPEQKLYYRFKQKDLDGRFTYSPVRSINFIQKNKEVIVYPNPTKNNLTIKVTAAKIGSFYFIADQLGRQVESGKLIKISNTINLSQVSAGIYYLKVAGATTQTIKIVKQ